MPSRPCPKAQLPLVLGPPKVSPLPVLPEGAAAILADLLLEAAGSQIANPTQEGGDEQQDRR